jgi:hypothetical protein
MSLTAKRVWCWGAGALTFTAALAFQINAWVEERTLPAGVWSVVVLVVFVLTCVGKWVGPTSIDDSQIEAFEASLNEVADRSVKTLVAAIAEQLAHLGQDLTNKVDAHQVVLMRALALLAGAADCEPVRAAQPYRRGARRKGKAADRGADPMDAELRGFLAARLDSVDPPGTDT